MTDKLNNILGYFAIKCRDGQWRVCEAQPCADDATKPHTPKRIEHKYFKTFHDAVVYANAGGEPAQIFYEQVMTTGEGALWPR